MITNAIKNTNDLVGELAQRAGHLSARPLAELRREFSGFSQDFGISAEAKAMDKAALVNAILLEEYCEELPRTIEEN